MIRACKEGDFEQIWRIINDGARAYQGVIPDDCWHEPYMSRDELRHEINNGVSFQGYEGDGALDGVMGIQNVDDVVLIRHAYVRTDRQGLGIGQKLLRALTREVKRPVLIGTWADASWAIGFYKRNGFRLLSSEEKDRLLRRYWKIPERQAQVSVVLADSNWSDDRA